MIPFQYCFTVQSLKRRTSCASSNILRFSKRFIVSVMKNVMLTHFVPFPRNSFDSSLKYDALLLSLICVEGILTFFFFLSDGQTATYYCVVAQPVKFETLSSTQWPTKRVNLYNINTSLSTGKKKIHHISLRVSRKTL